MSVADGQFGQQERRNIALTHQILNKWRVIDQPQYFNSSPLARQANQCFVCECMSESIGHIQFERYDKRIINNNNTMIHHQHHRQMNRQIEQEICSPTYLCVYLWTSLTPNNEFFFVVVVAQEEIQYSLSFSAYRIQCNISGIFCNDNLMYSGMIATTTTTKIPNFIHDTSPWVEYWKLCSPHCYIEYIDSLSDSIEYTMNT